MIRVMIVEDEPEARKLIEGLLRPYNDMVLVGSCGSVSEASILARACRPDLLLLDIKLPDGNGFDLLSGMGAFPFHVIFLTAFEEYAIKAIKYGALDYLLKPVSDQQLALALERVREAGLPPGGLEEGVEVARSFWYHTDSLKRRQIVLRSSRYLQVVNLEDILYGQSLGNYTRFHLADKRQVVASRNLKEFQDLLPPEMFLRPHRSFIVNLSCIDQVHHEGFLMLRTGEEIPISARRKEYVLSFFQQH